MSIILGIDPGTTTTGFAIIEKSGNSRNLIEYGIIETLPKDEFANKIVDIIKDLEEIIAKYKPDIVAIEKLFFSTNQKTAIEVSQSRGAMIHLFATKGLTILEYTPLQVKKGICSNGSANKMQVQKALKAILKLESLPKPDDAADAIAIAYIASLAK